MKKILNESDDHSLFWYSSISLIVMIIMRIVLEYIVEPSIIVAPFDTVIFWFQYAIYYITVFSAIALCFGYFGKQSLKKAWTESVSISWIILIPPIVNVLCIKFSIVSQVCTGYISETGFNLIKSLLTFGIFSTAACGSTPGIVVGIAMLIIFVYLKLRAMSSVKKSIIGTITATLIGFSQGALPGIIGSISWLIYKGMDITVWITDIIIPNSFLNSIHQFAFDSTPIELIQKFNDQQWLLQSWSLWMTRMHFISLFIVLFLIIKILLPHFYKTIRSTFQFSRIWLYGALIFLGMRIAENDSFITIITNPINISGLLILFISFFCISLSVTVMNDDIDYEIDEISNKSRPLLNGVSRSQYRIFSLLTGILGLVGASLISPVLLLIMMLGYGIVIIYSVPPFRFKKTILGTWMSAVLAALFAITAGYFFVSLEQHINMIPWVPIILFSLVFSIIILYKDFKDVLGDSENGVITLPILLGVMPAKIILGVLVTFGIISITLKWYSTPIVVGTCVGLLFFWYYHFSYKSITKTVFPLFLIWLTVALLFWK